jgi:hypothetical protein
MEKRELDGDRKGRRHLSLCFFSAFNAKLIQGRESYEAKYQLHMKCLTFEIILLFFFANIYSILIIRLFRTSNL